VNETGLKNRVKSYLVNTGWIVFKISDRFTAGIPDLVCMKDGRTIWIELKTPEGRVQPIQTWTINQIKSAGVEAYICRSIEEVKGIL